MNLCICGAQTDAAVPPVIVANVVAVPPQVQKERMQLQQTAW